MQLLCFWRWSSVHSTWTLCVVFSWSENNILLMSHVFCGNLSWLCTPSKCWTVILLQIHNETQQCPALHVTNALLLVLGWNQLWKLCRWACHIHPLTLVVLFWFEWKSGVSNELHFFICAQNSIFMLSYKVHSLAFSVLLWKHWLWEESKKPYRRFCTTKEGTEEFRNIAKPGKIFQRLMNQKIWK